MPFNKGYKQSKIILDKIKKVKADKYGQGICRGCGIQFDKYLTNQITCGNTDCKSISGRFKYEEGKLSPINHKAKTLSGSIRLGKGKQEKMIDLITSSLGTLCTYCDILLTLDNVSLDHKIPRQWSKVYNRKLKKSLFTKEEIQKLDRIENLHIICRACNQLKSNFNDEQFRLFLNFINQYPDIKTLLIKRLKVSNLIFRRG